MQGKGKIQLQKDQSISDGLKLAEKLQGNKITKEQFARKFAKLRHTAIFEPLTGLFSPYFFEVELKREMSIARRFGSPLCLMVIDLDHLKHINDTYGHTAGNKAISLLSKIILSHLRESDIPCRWGGDEFVIILPYTEVEQAVLIANRIKMLLRLSEIEEGKKKIKIGASTGIAKFLSLDTPAALFKKADRAVYEVKRTGRGEIMVYSQEMAKVGKKK